MATLTPQPVGSLTFAAASSGGDTVALGTKTTRPVILINNTSGSSVNVTLAGINPCSQGSLHNQVVACATGGITEIVPLPQTIDQTPATAGNVGLTYSATSNVGVAVVAS